jgi:hypothetical protein
MNHDKQLLASSCLSWFMLLAGAAESLPPNSATKSCTVYNYIRQQCNHPPQHCWCVCVCVPHSHTGL